MDAIIKIATAKKEFSQDQAAIMKRVALVLIQHNLSVEITIKRKVAKDKEIRLFKVS